MSPQLSLDPVLSTGEPSQITFRLAVIVIAALCCGPAGWGETGLGWRAMGKPSTKTVFAPLSIFPPLLLRAPTLLSLLIIVSS